MLGPHLVRKLPADNWEWYAKVLADPSDGEAWGALAAFSFDIRDGGWEIRWASLAKQAQLTNDAGAWSALAALYKRHRFLSAAAAAARHALRLNSRSVDAWIVYGHVLRAKGTDRSARRAYRIAWRLDPRDLVAAELATGAAALRTGHG
jgi:cytochrome c-type biogenesis protein CcmH/NrfG